MNTCSNQSELILSETKNDLE